MRTQTATWKATKLVITNIKRYNGTWVLEGNRTKLMIHENDSWELGRNEWMMAFPGKVSPDHRLGDIFP